MFHCSIALNCLCNITYRNFFYHRIFYTGFICKLFSFSWNSATTMLPQSANHEQKFDLRRYIIPVLSFYLLPWLLLYLNLLPIPPSITTSNNHNITITTAKVTTTCRIDMSHLDASSNINCKGEDCKLRKEIKCPRSSDKPDMVYCCQYSNQGQMWVDCCDANTYGILHHTTSNVIFIYIMIVSAILSVVCCPCSPMFRQFRQKIIRLCSSNTQKWLFYQIH